MSAGLNVVIYQSATSSTPVRSRGAGQNSIDDLQFSTGLPGGYIDCTFTVRQPASQLWDVDTGQKVLIRNGTSIVWWGWIEDVQRTVRGRVAEIQVQALGPWQQLQQRLIVSSAYTSADYTDIKLKEEFAAYCDLISSDYSNIVSTGQTFGGTYNKSYWPISDLVKLICDAGNSSGQQLLFAIWAPAAAWEPVTAGNVVPRPTFDTSDYGSYWTGSTGSWASTTTYHSAPQAVQASYVHASTYNSAYAHDATGGSPKVFPAAASTGYRIDYWYKFGAASGLKVRVDVKWYDSGKSLISTTTGTETTSTGGTDWTNFAQTVTSPAGTVYAQLWIYALIPTAANAVIFDDVYMYAAAAAATATSEPVAHLWARDLSTFDYFLHTTRASLDLLETTRELVNAVTVSYGSSSYTAYGQDTTSQGLYRRRDAVVAAGSEANSMLATAIRDAVLTAKKDPATESNQITLSAPGAIRNQRGRPVELWRLRAGDRLKVADGPYAGTIILLERTSWKAGQLTATPEARVDVPALLARNL